MPRQNRLTTASRVIAATLVSFASVAAAVDFPTRPVTLIAPTAAGGAIDSAARVFAEPLSQRLGQRLVIENRPGSNGIIGTGAVARAQPDGHTLAFTFSTAFTTAPHLVKAMPYDPLTDFAPVTMIGRISLVMVAHPSLKATNLREFIAAAKAAPGTIQYASGGDGSDHHLAMEMLNLAAGIKLNHVPYKSGPQGYADLLGGHVQIMFIAPGTAVRHVREGRINAFGVSSAGPQEGYAGVPPIGNVLPGYEYSGWFAIFAPKGTSADIVSRLNADFRAVLSIPEVTQNFGVIGLEPTPSTPAELAALVVADHKKIGALARAIGLKPQ